MLKELLKNKKFLNKIKKFLNKKEIIDIILFGSAARGKEEAKDIDILVVYEDNCNKVIEITQSIKNELKKEYHNVEVIGKKYKEVLKPTFLARESLLSEGFSFKYKKFISECFGYENYMLFKYSLKGKNKSERVKFYYGLYGRKNDGGIINKYNCYKLSEGILLCKIENAEIIKIFFSNFNIEYICFPILIPKRIIKYKIKK